MRPFLFCVVCAALSCQFCLQCTGQLVYALTVRDFLPQQCGLFAFPDTKAAEYVVRGAVDNECPYKDSLNSGVISGHPDFNSGKGSGGIPKYFYDKYKIDGSEGFLRPNNDEGEAAAEGRARFEKTVLESSILAPSGLPKPQYCDTNYVVSRIGMLRCGAYDPSPPRFITVRFQLKGILRLR